MSGSADNVSTLTGYTLGDAPESAQVLLDAVERNAGKLAAIVDNHVATLRNVSEEYAQVTNAYMYLYRSSSQKLTESIDANDLALHSLLQKVEQLHCGMEDLAMVSQQIQDIKANIGYLEDMWDLQMNDDPDKKALLRNYQQREGYWRKRMTALDAQGDGERTGDGAARDGGGRRTSTGDSHPLALP